MKTHQNTNMSVESGGERLPALIPIPQAAALLGLSRASAYRYAATGELPTKRFGRRVYVITNKIGDLLTAPVAAMSNGDAA
jgi:hypothetical protein